MWWIDILFPFSCLECHQFGSYHCDTCMKKAGYTPLICAVCRKATGRGKTHRKCMNGWSPDYSIVVWQYQGVVRKAIKTLKYQFAYQIAYSLGRKLSKELKKYDYVPTNATIVPIPLHKSRLNWRGFNQSEEIAEIVCKTYHWNLVTDVLLRSKQLQPQVKLRAFSRSQNIRGKFAINECFRDYFVNNSLPVILFDDVWSTGSTLFEATRVLRKAGARQVWWITLAR